MRGRTRVDVVYFQRANTISVLFSNVDGSEWHDEQWETADNESEHVILELTRRLRPDCGLVSEINLGTRKAQSSSHQLD